MATIKNFTTPVDYTAPIKSGIDEIDEGKLKTLNNFSITQEGFLVPRSGTETVLTAPTTINGIWSGTLGTVIAAGTALYKIVDGALEQIGITTNAKHTFVFVREVLYALNGVEYLKWTGTGEFTVVEGYIPLVYSNGGFAGASTPIYNEPINILTPKAKITTRSVLISDVVGTDAVSKYVIPDCTITDENGTEFNLLTKSNIISITNTNGTEIPLTFMDSSDHLFLYQSETVVNFAVGDSLEFIVKRATNPASISTANSFNVNLYSESAILTLTSDLITPVTDSLNVDGTPTVINAGEYTVAIASNPQDQSNPGGTFAITAELVDAESEVTPIINNTVNVLTTGTYTVRVILTGTAAPYEGADEEGQTVTLAGALNVNLGVVRVTFTNIRTVIVPIADRSEVTSMKYAALYGGDANTRVFLWGDTTNRMIYSELVDGVISAEYFPLLNYKTVGNTSTRITDLKRHYSTLFIAANDGAYYAKYTTIPDANDIPVAAFPTLPLHESVGGDFINTAQFIKNSPITFYGGKVYMWQSTNIQDERNALVISQNINVSAVICTYDKEETTELLIATAADILVYNYGVEAWYRWGIANVTGFVLIDNVLHYSVGGALHKFNETALDGATAFTSEIETSSIDFDSYREKTVDRLRITVIPTTNSSVTIYANDNLLKTELIPSSGITIKRFMLMLKRLPHIRFKLQFNGKIKIHNIYVSGFAATKEVK